MFTSLTFEPVNGGDPITFGLHEIVALAKKITDELVNKISAQDVFIPTIGVFNEILKSAVITRPRRDGDVRIYECNRSERTTKLTEFISVFSPEFQRGDLDEYFLLPLRIQNMTTIQHWLYVSNVIRKSYQNQPNCAWWMEIGGRLLKIKNEHKALLYIYPDEKDQRIKWIESELNQQHTPPFVEDVDMHVDHEEWLLDSFSRAKDLTFSFLIYQKNQNWMLLAKRPEIIHEDFTKTVKQVCQKSQSLSDVQSKKEEILCRVLKYRANVYVYPKEETQRLVWIESELYVKYPPPFVKTMNIDDDHEKWLVDTFSAVKDISVEFLLYHKNQTWKVLSKKSKIVHGDITNSVKETYITEQSYSDLGSGGGEILCRMILNKGCNNMLIYPDEKGQRSEWIQFVLHQNYTPLFVETVDIEDDHEKWLVNTFKQVKDLNYESLLYRKNQSWNLLAKTSKIVSQDLTAKEPSKKNPFLDVHVKSESIRNRIFENDAKLHIYPEDKAERSSWIESVLHQKYTPLFVETMDILEDHEKWLKETFSAATDLTFEILLYQKNKNWMLLSKKLMIVHEDVSIIVKKICNENMSFLHVQCKSDEILRKLVETKFQEQVFYVSDFGNCQQILQITQKIGIEGESPSETVLDKASAHPNNSREEALSQTNASSLFDQIIQAETTVIYFVPDLQLKRSLAFEVFEQNLRDYYRGLSEQTFSPQNDEIPELTTQDIFEDMESRMKNRTALFILTRDTIYGFHDKIVKPYKIFGDRYGVGNSYDTFAHEFDHYKQRVTNALSEEELASKMREILKGGVTVPDDLHFLSNLAGSWFMAEVIRNPMSMMCGLMLLDMIENGCVSNFEPEKNWYSWKYTLIHPKKDDPRSKKVDDAYGKNRIEVDKFGGSHPMAHRNSYRDGLQSPTNLNLSTTRQKEGSLIIHWLYETLKLKGCTFKVSMSTKMLKPNNSHDYSEINGDAFAKVTKRIDKLNKTLDSRPDDAKTVNDLKRKNEIEEKKKYLAKIVLKYNVQSEIIEALLRQRLSNLDLVNESWSAEMALPPPLNGQDRRLLQYQDDSFINNLLDLAREPGHEEDIKRLWKIAECLRTEDEQDLIIALIMSKDDNNIFPFHLLNR